MSRHLFGVECAVWMLLGIAAWAQVITVDTHTGAVTNGGADAVDRRYAQIEPTHVALGKGPLDAKTQLELLRVLQAEQGFAMRPFPRGHKGLTLKANGNLTPAGNSYLDMVIKEGASAKPGDRVVLSEVKIERTRIVFDLNGGPDSKHRFLRHVQVGAGPMANPVPQTNDQEPLGARLTLSFDGPLPELTSAEVKELLTPLISFDLKTPIQAFTDTLPAKLKEAILGHHVLVGMTTEMVLFAKGPPQTKTREMDGKMPFEEWIYGRPPEPVEFVRINGNRVIRLEVAKVGETPTILTRDEVIGLMRTDGAPLEAATAHTRTVAEGDAERNPDMQAPNAAPSLRNPGEKLPTDEEKTGVMRPVRDPKPRQQPGANPDGEPESDASSQNPAAPTEQPK
jgi:hypothetical protein